MAKKPHKIDSKSNTGKIKITKEHKQASSIGSSFSFKVSSHGSDNA